MPKAQMQAFSYVLIAIVALGIMITSYQLTICFREKQCVAELTSFITGIQADSPRVSRQAGAVLEKRYKGFCGAEQVYFVDEDIKNRVLNNPPFARLPLVVDSLSSNTGNNMYIVKKGKILDQVNIGDLNIGYPDYLCYTSEFGVIDVLLRGTGRGTNIMPKNPGFSCGPMPVEPDFREQEEIAGEVVTRQVNSAENPILQDIRTATVFQTDSGGSLQIG